MTPNMNVTLPGGLRISTLPASSSGGPTAASSSGGLPTPTSAGGLSSLAPTGGMATGSGLTHAPEQPPHPTQDVVYSAVAKFRKAAREAPRPAVFIRSFSESRILFIVFIHSSLSLPTIVCFFHIYGFYSFTLKSRICRKFCF